MKKAHERKSPQVRPKHRHSPRDGVAAYTCSPRCPDLLVTVACGSSSASLTPAQGRQDHTPSPSAPAALVARAVASIASRLAFRDDAQRPSASRRDQPKRTIIFRKAEEKYFTRRDLTRFLKISRRANQFRPKPLSWFDALLTMRVFEANEPSSPLLPDRPSRSKTRSAARSAR
jgi:hypothetical protein